MSDQDRQMIRVVTWVGLVGNFLLSVVKCSIGFIGRSQALIADGIHSLSDITTDLAILIGKNYWYAPADKNHPYGHRRIETIVTLAIGIILVGAAIGISFDAFKHLAHPTEQPPRTITLLIALMSIVVKEGLYQYTHRVGRHIQSSALLANALHHRTDALSSIPVAIAILVSILQPAWTFIDSVGALVVSAFIIYSAWKVLEPALEELSDHGACEKTQQIIISHAQQVQGVHEVHAVRTRKTGPGWFVDMHVLVDPTISVVAGHDIAIDVKHTILEKIPSVIDVLVHIEPYEKLGASY